ncbi:cell envelope biogenesis protein LolA [Mangrovimonas yunxiaonensis]|uniref:Cell envelope biogenesis protein LolA n=2 Tax=Mangrovimonas yunxiaonensis TaxID=1197477 RepID=A0A084TK95_9FLAO|nr:cell envelope biogenesis protein LolA [Mangrovimonas yunxiaonensis]
MHKLIFICCFVCCSIQAQTKMTTTEAENLKALVKLQAETTKTIVSDFTQYKHLDFLSNDIVTKGRLHFKAPNLVKWAYNHPFEYAVIFKNESLYINDEGHKSQIDIGASKMFKQLNQLIVKSVKGDMFNEAEFDITYYKAAQKSEVHFSPKNPEFSEFITSFQIIFSKKGDVEQVKMIEPSGDFTKIVFSNRTLNTPVNHAVFNH